jgi:glycosyltransferase involved in cell wall biosynthesis
MQIVVNSGFLSEIYPGEYINFLCKTFERITKNHPEHHFIFLCERQNTGLFAFGNNVKTEVIKHHIANPLLWKYWYDVRVPIILRKYKADVLITTSGFCSLTAKVPQCMIIQDLAFLHSPSFFTKTKHLFYKRYTGKFIEKAKRIVTFSAFSKLDIVNSYGITDTKIDTVYNGVNEIFKPVNEAIKKEIKEKYTGGKDFFLYSGAIHPSKNLTNLLKAFSIFKKRQQSNMKLLLCSKLTSGYKSFTQSLHTYKYRAAVVLLQNTGETEMAKLTASAYALVYPVYFDSFSAPVMEAMQCKVPVITSVNSPMQEITGDAALYADPGNYNAIAEQLIRLYKDENSRNELINKGEIVVRQYNWDKTADLLWLTIQKTIQ